MHSHIKSMYSILQKGITVQMDFPFLHPSHLFPLFFCFSFPPFLLFLSFLPLSLSLSYIYLFVIWTFLKKLFTYF